MRQVVVALLLIVGVTTALQAAQVQLADELTRRQALDRYRAGEELMQAELWEKAAREFQAAIDLDPLFTLAHYSLGQAYMALKRPASALQAYLDCREAYQRLSALGQRERIEMEKRREDEIREIRSSIEALRSGRVKSATLIPTMTRYEERLRMLEQGRMRSAQQRDEIPPELSLALGSAYFRLDRLPEAEREYLAAVEANPKLGAAHNNLAVVYMLTGRYDQAEQELRLAERNGFKVNPDLKDDLKKARAGK
jgi:tetratricopeptide (TPR) repeat protein